MNLFNGPYGEPEPGWPRDSEGRFMCDAIKHMPPDSIGSWVHKDAYPVGSCEYGCCTSYICPHCNEQFTVSDEDAS